MGKIALSEFEKRRLITTYKSELRELLYQVERVTDQIRGLSAGLSDVGQEDMSQVINMASAALDIDESEVSLSDSRADMPGIPMMRKNKKRLKPKRNISNRGPGRPPKGSHTFTYTTQDGEEHELGEWDELVIKGIHEAKQPLINSELLELSMNTSLGQEMGEEKAKLMISRTIHKLVNRKPILKKAPYNGRGNAYATEGMLDVNGNVKKEYQR
jgi:hypothetical protein